MVGVSQMDLDYKNRTLWFILLSLLIHSLVMFMLSHQWGSHSTAADSSVAVDVVPLTAQQIEQIKGQVVETSQTKKSEKAAKDAFLSKQTQIVERQTKSRTTAPFHDGRSGGAPEPEQKNVTLGNLGVKMNFKPMGNAGPGETASTSDYLKQVEQGAQTLLNTKEYAYYSFYQRVRQQLEQYWEPGLRQRLKNMFDRGRKLAADHEHATKLTVVMAIDGSITRILVDGTSGMLDLDQAAIDAFNKAGPFPNPPKGLVEHDGTVKIEWEFVLKT